MATRPTHFDFGLVLSGFISALAVEIALGRMEGNVSLPLLDLISHPAFIAGVIVISMVFRFFHGNAALSYALAGVPPLPRPNRDEGKVKYSAYHFTTFLRSFGPYVIHPTQYVLFCLLAFAIPVVEEGDPAPGFEIWTSFFWWLATVSLFDVVVAGSAALSAELGPRRRGDDPHAPVADLLQSTVLRWALINAVTVALLALLVLTARQVATFSQGRFWSALVVLYLAMMVWDYGSNRRLFFHQMSNG